MIVLRPGFEAITHGVLARVMAGRLTPLAAIDEAFETLVSSVGCSREELERDLTAAAAALESEEP